MEDGGPVLVEHVTKIEAVRRQLRTAYAMFFHEEDSVSIHTLASAAQEVLHDLLKRSGRGSAFIEGEFVRPEKLPEYRKMISEAKNFFKHANRDPDKVLDFHPATNDFVLMDCAHMYLLFSGGRWLRETVPFIAWFAATYPGILLPQAEEQALTWLPLIRDAAQLVPQSEWKAAFLLGLERWRDSDNTD
jgi:hypothetical protein